MMNAVDVAALRQLKEKFRPCFDRTDLKRGLIGWFCRAPCDYPADHRCHHPTETAIYVSRAIQVGYYFEGEPPAAILERIEGEPRRIKDELPIDVEDTIIMGLRPFMQSR